MSSFMLLGKTTLYDKEPAVCLIRLLRERSRQT
jgi:hypothetical protein